MIAYIILTILIFILLIIDYINSKEIKDILIIQSMRIDLVNNEIEKLKEKSNEG